MDAHCALCSWGAKWIARNDDQQEFRIIPVQTELGRALLEHYDLDPEDPNSWLFVYGGTAYKSSDAVIRAGMRLGGISRLLAVGLLIPRPVRDWAYFFVARNRYRWFGQADMCNLPDAEVQKRLYLHDAPGAQRATS